MTPPAMQMRFISKQRQIHNENALTSVRNLTDVNAASQAQPQFHLFSTATHRSYVAVTVKYKTQ